LSEGGIMHWLKVSENRLRCLETGAEISLNRKRASIRISAPYGKSPGDIEFSDGNFASEAFEVLATSLDSKVI